MNSILIISTTLTNLAALYPIYKLYSANRIYGVIITSLSMLASMLHHIALTSETKKVKGFILTKYSEKFLFFDRLFASNDILYGIYLLSHNFNSNKLIVPFLATLCMLLSEFVLPFNKKTKQIYNNLCVYLFGRKISHTTNLIIHTVLHNIWHVAAFYSLADVIPH